MVDHKMENILTIFAALLKPLTILAALTTIWGALLYIFRERLYASVLQLSLEKQKRFYNIQLSALRLLRLYLILIPLHSIGVPILFYYLREDLSPVINLPWLIALLWLINVNTLEMVLYRGWLVKALERGLQAHETTPAA